MPKYVVLSTWTKQGIEAAGDTVERAERGRQRAEALGGHQDVLLWTMGRYDMIGVYDMPSDEAFASLILQTDEGGMLRTESLRGFTAGEIAGILGSAG